MQVFINTRGSIVRRQGQRFIVQQREYAKKAEIAASKVQSLVIATAASITTGAMELAYENAIDICLLNRSGDAYARVWQPRWGSTAAIRRAQMTAAEGVDGLSICKDWLSKKLEAQSQFLKLLGEKRPKHAEMMNNACHIIAETTAKLNVCEGDLQSQRSTLLGYEGISGRVYFDAISKVMPAEYRFNGRSRRPAVDPYNAMLNYAYGILYSLIDRSLILAGLDPQLGFLHTDNYNKRSLVFDMIEPFRVIAERSTTLFFTGRRVKKNFFREVPGGVELAPDGRAALVGNINQRLDKSIKYPVKRTAAGGSQKFRRVKLRTTIQYEAHALANRLLGKHELPRITESETLLREANQPEEDT